MWSVNAPAKMPQRAFCEEKNVMLAPFALQEAMRADLELFGFRSGRGWILEVLCFQDAVVVEGLGNGQDSVAV